MTEIVPQVIVGRLRESVEFIRLQLFFLVGLGFFGHSSRLQKVNVMNRETEICRQDACTYLLVRRGGRWRRVAAVPVLLHRAVALDGLVGRWRDVWCDVGHVWCLRGEIVVSSVGSIGMVFSKSQGWFGFALDQSCAIWWRIPIL